MIFSGGGIKNWMLRKSIPIFFILIALTILLTDRENSSYEILIILPIITTVVAHGYKGGMLMAGIGSLYLLYNHIPAAITAQSLIPTRILSILASSF